MNGDLYYVYVLKLSNKGFYIGSTKNLENRIKKHFSIGGSIATKESKPIEVVEICEIIDYKMKFEYAHIILEISTAIKFANTHGKNQVRGAKHGMGWDDSPTPNGLRVIKKVQSLMGTEEFQQMIEKVKYHKLFDDHNMNIPDNLFRKRKTKAQHHV